MPTRIRTDVGKLESGVGLDDIISGDPAVGGSMETRGVNNYDNLLRPQAPAMSLTWWHRRA